MNKKHGFSPIIVALIVVVLLGTGFAAYKVSQKSTVETPDVASEQNQTTNSTKDWKTYRSEAYDFEIKYPIDWVSTKGNFDGGLAGFFSVAFGLPDAVNTKPLAEIRVYPNQTTLEQFLKYNQNIKGSWTDITIDGISAKQIITTGQNSKKFILIMFVKNGFGYELMSTVFEENVEVVQKMSATFKFTPPTPPTEVKGDVGFAIQVLSPKTGDVFKIGNKIVIKWKDRSDAANYTITLINRNTSKVDLIIANNVFVRSSGIDGTSSYEWTIPDVDTKTTYNIEVYQATARELTGRSQLFTITNDQPSITVLSPNGGETMKIGDKRTILFNATGTLKPEYKIALILEPGLIPLKILPATSTSFEWTVPEMACLGGDACGPLTPGAYSITAQLYDNDVCIGFCVQTGAKLLSEDKSNADFTITK